MFFRVLSADVLDEILFAALIQCIRVDAIETESKTHLSVFLGNFCYLIDQIEL
jgi:hypothetical protein